MVKLLSLVMDLFMHSDDKDSIFVLLLSSIQDLRERERRGVDGGSKAFLSFLNGGSNECFTAISILGPRGGNKTGEEIPIIQFISHHLYINIMLVALLLSLVFLS